MGGGGTGPRRLPYIRLCSVSSDAGIFFFSFDQRILLLLTHPGFIKSYFDSLYDEEIITEESFYVWESSVEEKLGKGAAIAGSSEFFRWLRSAAEEPDE